MMSYEALQNVRRWAGVIIGGVIFLAFCYHTAQATFPGSPGSTQYRNPAYLRQYYPTTLTIAQNNTINVDWRDGPWFQIKLTANVSFNVPVNVGGNCILITLIQDSVGSRTAAWSNTTGGAGWKWSGGTAGTLTTTASAVDQVTACPWEAGVGNAASVALATNFK